MNPAYDMYETQQQQQRSPGSNRHQNQHRDLNRQPSRQFDGYGNLNVYQHDDGSRYDNSRPYDRVNATMHASNYGQPQHDFGGASAWNTANGASFGMNNTMNPMAGRMKGQSRGRSNLPTDWMQTSHNIPPVPSFPGLGHNGPSPLGNIPVRQDTYGQDDNDELIPTAIVIKNIPFAVKKEQLVQLMTDMRLPLPYAFNYHFDNGVFRGLAFANFTTAEETAAVIELLNHFELHGRKLRVEYKKMLPLAERERIEREKRERRGQLQEQHMPNPGQPLNSQPSIGSMHSHGPATSPSPVAGRNPKPGRTIVARHPQSLITNDVSEVDLNDPQVLQYYSQLLLFREDVDRDSMAFPPTLQPLQRRMVHTLAHQMGLMHISKGNGDQRQVHVLKVHGDPNMSPPIPAMPAHHDPHRRALNRAATTDFSDVRAAEGFYGTLGRQGSGYLGFPDSPSGLNAAQNLRAAKSYADLRSYTPSPVPSTASFPPTLNQANLGRLMEYQSASSASAIPSIPTTAGMTSREENLLINGLNGMSLGSGFNTQGSPNRALRGVVSWDRDNGLGTIGGHRSMSTNYEEHSRERGQAHPSRQPRGPIGGTGFSRSRQNGHHGRGSDELSLQSGVEIKVE